MFALLPTTIHFRFRLFDFERFWLQNSHGVFSLQFIFSSFFFILNHLKWHTSGDYVMIFSMQLWKNCKGDREVYGIGYIFLFFLIVIIVTFFFLFWCLLPVYLNSIQRNILKWKRACLSDMIREMLTNIYGLKRMTWHCIDMNNWKHTHIATNCRSSLYLLPSHVELFMCTNLN